MAQQKPQHWTPAWSAIVGGLALVAAALAVRGAINAEVVPTGQRWFLLPLAGIGGGFAALYAAFANEAWLPTMAHRAGTVLTAGLWLWWASWAGAQTRLWLAVTLPVLVAGSAVLAPACRPPEPEARSVDDDDRGDRRPAEVRQWEQDIRACGGARKALTVTALEPWDNPGDGVRVHVDLPPDGSMSWRSLDRDFCERLQARRRLPQGCAIRVLEGDHQGTVILDVMLRDCLAREITVPEDYSPASVNDTFTLMYSPRGELLDACLREQSMVVGGTVGSGKTTLLHRIILFLARCTDALVWVVDINGGGVAEPWIRPWATGQADRPVVDWVADNEAEAAALLAVATAVAKDRKTSREASRRKRLANTTVLPVDADLPAIIVLTDEGGEVRQAVSAAGRAAGEMLARLAQIGRAEGARVVISVLRGTGDLLEKALRAVAAIKICLRMDEEGEYSHVLGVEPGRTKLIHKGSGYIYRSSDYRPVFARTVNMLLSQIERAAIECAPLRPELDERGQRVAAKVGPEDVLNGRDPMADPATMRHPVLRDAQAGRLYEGRWERYAAKLAEMRGEEPREDDDPQPPTPPAGPRLGDAQSALVAAVGPTPAPVSPAGEQVTPAPSRLDLADKAVLDREAQRLIAAWASDVDLPGESRPAVPAGEVPDGKVSTREQIVAILREAHPGRLTSGQIGIALAQRGADVSKDYRQQVLRAMRERGEIDLANGAYGLVGMP